MKRPIAIAFALLTLILTGCTQNNGDLDGLFGFWRLQKFEINGNPAPDVHPGEYIWAFQGHVIQITRNIGNHEVVQWYGEFAQHPSELILDFTHWKAETGWEFHYHMPKALLLPDDTPVTLHIERRTSSDLILTYEAQTYTLTKVY